MNRRAIAIPLALLLAISGICLADEGEAPSPQSAVEAEAPSVEAAKEAPAEAAKDTSGEAAKEAPAEASPSAPEDPAPEAEIHEEDALEAVEFAEDGSEASGEGGGDGGSGDSGDSGEGEAEPTAEPEATPAPEGTPSPDATPAPDDTSSPDATPAPDDTSSPDDTPAPDAGLTVSVEGAERLEDGAWQVSYASPEDRIRFTWSAVEGASGYAWEVANAAGESVASGSVDGAALELSAGDYLSGRYTLTVRAELPEGMEPVEARCAFELKQSERPGEEQSGERPGGFGGFGGGRPSSSGGSSSGGSASAQAEQGLHVTPGEALTDDHASGDKDMTAYGAVRLTIEDAAQTQLTLGDMELGVSRADGGGFTAELSGGSLVLRAEGGAEWSVSALALEVLERSGVDELALVSGESAFSLPTDLALGGPIYAAYRARGYVSKDFELRAGPSGVAVLVDGERYALDGDGALIRE